MLPGFEATSSEGAHLLALFEPETPLEELERRIGECGRDFTTGASTPSSKRFVELLQLAAHEWGATVLAPHIAAPVPELLVSDLDRSLDFWRGICGFTVRYTRPDERFVYITLGSAHVMLEQAGVGRNWITGPLEPPLGRGINFQITVRDSVAIAASLDAAGVELFM